MLPTLGISLQADAEFLCLNRALIEDDAEIFEINPETLWTGAAEPGPLYDTFLEMLECSGRPAIGHGILYSLGAASAPPRRDLWLAALQRDQAAFRYLWYSEHLGFSDHGELHVALPLPLPVADEVVDVVVQGLEPLQATFGSVAFENNVAYFSLGDPMREPDLFRAICERSGCKMVLDLHNAYTQCLNLGVDLEIWLDALPKEHVLEIHLSGGSMSDPTWLASGRQFRLDSHDGAVPDPVWSSFERLLPECPELQAVILEWMPDEMDEDGAARWRSDFRRARRILCR